MRIGLTCPRYQDFGLLYPESRRLQTALCEYFVVIVHLCKQAVLFLKKPFWNQLSSSVLKPFQSEFGGFQKDLESLASAIREEISLASNQAQQIEATEMSKFRAFVHNTSDASTLRLGSARAQKRRMAELGFLDACSVYDHEKSWKQARKQGNTEWIFDDEKYKKWKVEKSSSTLWCTGILGSGKTVLSANLVEELKISAPAVVSYFFCRHDETESLKTRTIMKSIARQIFDHIKSDIADSTIEMRPSTIDIDQILDHLQELLPSRSHHYFIIIDGLDECENNERRLLLHCLKQLLLSKHIFKVYCSSRPDVSRWAYTLLEPQWNVSMPQTSIDIEQYVKSTLVRHLESGYLSLGDSTIILTIQDTLLKKHTECESSLLKSFRRLKSPIISRFLWVVFQIDSICFEKTDAAILKALQTLPKDLPETFDRILRTLHHSNAADPQFCRKIFCLVAAAQRPLTLEELREAVSVDSGDTTWDSSKLVNDMLRSLLDSCGSLVAVDEEHLTVHFAHHSVRQHLLSKPSMDSNLEIYHINMNRADLYLGDIIVTYLNFGVFDQQLTKAKAKSTQNKIYPSDILAGSLPGSSIANRLAVKLLKKRENSSLDIHRQLTARIVFRSQDQIEPAHSFLAYAQEYWLFHTKMFKPARGREHTLWQRLIDKEVETVELPWAPNDWRDFGDEYIRWITQNGHWALIHRSLVELVKLPKMKLKSLYTIAKVLSETLEKRVTDTNDPEIDLECALYLASVLNNKSVTLLLLKYGTIFNPADRLFGAALQTASALGHLEMVESLLAKGANVDSEGGYHGTALQAASKGGYEAIARLLIKKGADVNLMSGAHGTALQVASAYGQEEMTKLLLVNGADVNAEAGDHGTALDAASNGGHDAIVRLLLENGATSLNTILNAASKSGN